jgi:plasmid stabilization system protein ParE
LKIVWSPEAADDLETAVQYLAERNPVASARVAMGILALIERLAVEPIVGPEHVLASGERVRGWPYPPFRVYYQRKDEVLSVLRVYHQRRFPIVR